MKNEQDGYVVKWTSILTGAVGYGTLPRPLTDCRDTCDSANIRNPDFVHEPIESNSVLRNTTG